mgnify:CR=1 FL=1
MDDLLERRLYCSVCLDIVGADACQFLCPGQHAICFSCCVQYCLSLSDYKTLKCPTCKTGDGTIIFSSMLSDLGQLYKEQDQTDSKASVDQYFQMASRLTQDYPTIFLHYDITRKVTPLQMVLYARELVSTVETTERRVQFRHIRPPQAWICVVIHRRSEDYLMSYHVNEDDALRSIQQTRNRYSICFILEVRGETLTDCFVIHQERPIYLTLIEPFVSYLDDTFSLSFTCRDRIKSSILTELANLSTNIV